MELRSGINDEDPLVKAAALKCIALLATHGIPDQQVEIMILMPTQMNL